MQNRMTRRTFMGGVASAVVGTVVLRAPSVTAREERKWNVLWITADDLNYDSVGYVGCPVRDITPNIDALARRGMFFEHAHVPISVCVPCRTGLLTARYPHSFSPGYQSGKLQYRAKVGTSNITHRLREAGYFTAMLCKVRAHHVPEEQFVWDLSYDQRAEDFEKTGHGRDPQKLARSTAEVVRKARAAGKPFFLKVNINDPHRPFPNSEREKRTTTGGYRFLGQVSRPSRTYTADQVPVPGFLPDTPAVRQKIAEYFGGAKRCDDCVGAVYQALEESGERDNTIVVFLSDHGMPFPFAKENCYRHSTRSPTVVIWPGVTKPGYREAHHTINALDVVPTILEILGLPPLEGADGRSFAPLLRGEKQAGREFVVTVFHHTPGQRNAYEMRAINDTRYGYVYNAWADGQLKYNAGDPDNGPAMDAMVETAKTDPKAAERLEFYYYRTPEELYDYENDPHALHNLIDEPACQDTAKRLRQGLLAWINQTGDPLEEAFRRVMRSHDNGSQS